LHEGITPLGVEEFSRLYVSFHNLLFPDDRFDDSILWDLVEESRLASSLYGVEFFGVSVEGGIVGLFSLLRRSSDVIDCKIEVVGEPPGGFLGDVIVDYLERNCSRPQVIVPAGLTATISRLEASGYKLHSRLARLAIDLKEFNLDSFRGYIERLSMEGFTFKPLSSVADRILDVVWLVNETSRDEPTGGMSYTMTVEELKYLIDQGRLVGGACYIAFKDGEVVAVTLVVRASVREAYFTYTGVLRPYRGLGLAKAVKALALAKLRELGYLRASANNNLVNKPIIAVNRKLGFKIVRELLDYRKGE
jgi:GNAT superfamily N-acetyltransferase